MCCHAGQQRGLPHLEPWGDFSLLGESPTGFENKLHRLKLQNKIRKADAKWENILAMCVSPIINSFNYWVQTRFYSSKDLPKHVPIQKKSGGGIL